MGDGDDKNEKKNGKHADGGAVTTDPVKQDGAIPPPAPAVSAVVPGAYKIWPLDRDGNYIKLEWVLDKDGKRTNELEYPPDPADHYAVEINFGVIDANTSPPKDQMDLQDAIGQVLETVKTLYLRENGEQGAKFRLFYVRLFSLAQLGLEGNAMPDVARAALERVIDDLIRTEGPRVKNLHLRALGAAGAKLGAAALLVYAILSLGALGEVLGKLDIDRDVTRSFMMVWLGCFVGVWLSYALRKSVLKLRDLIVAEDDFLEPFTRMIFAGLLSNIIASLLFFEVIKIAIGPLSLNVFAENPAVALLLGIVLGINELLLPTAVSDKTRDLLDKI